MNNSKKKNLFAIIIQLLIFIIGLNILVSTIYIYIKESLTDEKQINFLEVKKTDNLFR